MSKPVTRFQQDIHAVLTGALLISAPAGAWLGWYLWTEKEVLSTHALIWGAMVPILVLLVWLDTEVQWRKREAVARKVLARITGN